MAVSFWHLIVHLPCNTSVLLRHLHNNLTQKYPRQRCKAIKSGKTGVPDAAKPAGRIAAAWNADGWTFEALEAHYKTLVRYLNLKDMGAVWGKGCGTPSMTKRSRYVQQAYELGKNLK